jgi:hypothetical protein
VPAGSPITAPVGIGGALLVFVLGIIAAGFANFAWLMSNGATTGNAPQASQGLPPLAGPLVVGSTLWGLAAVFCLFWFRDRRGPLAARSFMVVYLLSGLAVPLLPQAAAAGTRVFPLMWVASAAIYNAVWQTYFSRSGRVRATYQAGLPRRPVVALGQLAALAAGIAAAGVVAARVGDLARLWNLEASSAQVRLDGDTEQPPGRNELAETADRLRDRLDARGLNAGQVRVPDTSSAPIEVVYLHPRGSDGPPPAWVLRRGVLEFVEVLEGPFATEVEAERARRAHPDARVLRSKASTDHIYLCRREALLDNVSVRSARLDRDSVGAPAVSAELTAGGGIAMRKFAAAAGRRLAIVLDDVVLSAPVIRGELGQQVQIAPLTPAEASELKAVLTSGLPLPRSLRVVEVQPLRSSVPWLARRSILLAASTLPAAILLTLAVVGFLWLGARERRGLPDAAAMGRDSSGKGPL